MEQPGAGWSKGGKHVGFSGDEGREKKFEKDERYSTLNTSTNVLLMFRLNHLQEMRNANFVLGVLALLYSGVCVVLLVLNHANHNDDDCDDPDEIYIARCGSAISDMIFHRFEFWAAFCFALVTVFALNYTPKATSNIYESPLVLKLVLLAEVCLAAVPALLVTFNLEFYEVPSHELEYLNELTVSFVDIILLTSLLRLPEEEEAELMLEEASGDTEQTPTNSALVASHFSSNDSSSVAGFASATKLFRSTSRVDEGTITEGNEEEEEEEDEESLAVVPVKNTLYQQATSSTKIPLLQSASSSMSSRPEKMSGKRRACLSRYLSWFSSISYSSMVPMFAAGVAALQLIIYNLPFEASEKVAHYFEFSFGIISAFVTFWFCMDNRFACETEIMEILHGTHKDCANCIRECMELNSMKIDHVPGKLTKRPSVALSIRRTIHRALHKPSPNPDQNTRTSARYGSFYTNGSTELASRRSTGLIQNASIPLSSQTATALNYDACRPQPTPANTDIGFTPSV